MNPGLEESIRSVLTLQTISQATNKVPDEILRRIRVIRDRSLQAEKDESVDGLSSWRRSHQKNGHGDHNNGNRNGESSRWRTTPNTHSQNSAKPATHQGHQGHHVRYVSKFKNPSVPVEDTILNQVILNKLNKFSLSNYNEVKSFLQQILDGDDKQFLQNFMKLVFEKAASEPTFCPLYARMISELLSEYDILYKELKNLYEEYLSIFDEVAETTSETYDSFVQRTKEKGHRLGYSQFLAELTSRGSLDLENISLIFKKIISQIAIYGKKEGHEQLVDEYTQCLLRMTEAFKNTANSAKLRTIRQGLLELSQRQMNDFVKHRMEIYPGITKKTSFGFMDCLDNLR